MNMGHEDDELKPYSEPEVDLSDQKRIEMLVGLGYNRTEIEDSLKTQKYDDVFATYLLLARRSTDVSFQLLFPLVFMYVYSVTARLQFSSASSWKATVLGLGALCRFEVLHGRKLPRQYLDRHPWSLRRAIHRKRRPDRLQARPTLRVNGVFIAPFLPRLKPEVAGRRLEVRHAKRPQMPVPRAPLRQPPMQPVRQRQLRRLLAAALPRPPLPRRPTTSRPQFKTTSSAGRTRSIRPPLRKRPPD